jgi:hypothetical protein
MESTTTASDGDDPPLGESIASIANGLIKTSTAAVSVISAVTYHWGAGLVIVGVVLLALFVRRTPW